MPVEETRRPRVAREFAAFVVGLSCLAVAAALSSRSGTSDVVFCVVAFLVGFPLIERARGRTWRQSATYSALSFLAVGVASLACAVLQRTVSGSAIFGRWLCAPVAVWFAVAALTHAFASRLFRIQNNG
jgi:hypothetical protein